MVAEVDTITTVRPWQPQGKALNFGFDQGKKIYEGNIDQGMPAWSDAGSEALNQMAGIARGYNPFMQPAQHAVTGVASGQNGINTGGMFGDLYNSGINTQGMFNNVYGNAVGSPGMLSRGLYGAIGQGDLLSKRGSPGGYSPPGWQSGGYSPSDGPGFTPGGLQPGTGGDPNYSQAGQRQRPPGAEDAFAVTSNPYLDAARNDAMRQTGNQIKASMSGAGRYGSGAYGEGMARGLGGVAAQFNMSGYENDMNRMMQAAQAGSQENLALQGLGLSAAQGATGVQGQNIANRLSAAQGATGVQSQNITNQMQAAGMSPAMSDFRYSDAQKLAEVGGARDMRNQQEQQFSNEQLRQYMSMLGSVPGSAGVSTTQGPGSSGWLNALGGAAAGAGIGTAINPGVGTAIGGALGGLGGWLFG